MKMKLISFCLYGQNPKYLVGAVENARMAKDFYPDWTCIFWLPQPPSTLYPPEEVVEKLTKLDAVIAYSPPAFEECQMFSRFLTADFGFMERMICRDVDSRFTEREVAAVREWEKSEKLFHVIRDHPAHCREINGGLWGCVKGAVPNIKTTILDWLRKNPPPHGYDADQQFLCSQIWPVVKNHTLQHDAFCNYPDSQPFPVKRQGHRFVGEVFTEKNEPRERDWESIPADSF